MCQEKERKKKDANYTLTYLAIKVAGDSFT